MKEFGHFYEFFAALNSASIVSNEYLDDLTKINNHFTALTNEHQKLRERSLYYHNLLVNESKIYAKSGWRHALQKHLAPLHQKRDDLTTKVSATGIAAEKCVNKYTISENFNFLCLFGCLYCILMLVLIGFEFHVDTHPNMELFFLFNVISIGFLSLLFFSKDTLKVLDISASYKSVLTFFFVSIFLAAACKYFLVNNYIPTCYYDFAWLNLTMSITIPTSHFIYFFFRSSLSTDARMTSKKLMREIESIQRQYDDFGGEIAEAFKIFKQSPVRKQIDDSILLGELEILLNDEDSEPGNNVRLSDVWVVKPKT